MQRFITGFVCGLVLGACGLGEPPKADGEPCSEDSECASDNCLAGACGGSHCDCGITPCGLSGRPSSDCSSGWKCVGTASNLLYTGNCRELCSSESACPEDYWCEDGICRAPAMTVDEPVVTVTVEPEEAAIGEPVLFTADAMSENGAIVAYEWAFADGAPDQGPVMERVFDDIGSYSMEMTVTDEAGAVGTAHFSVRICLPPGSGCFAFSSQGNCCTGFRCAPLAEGEPSTCNE